MAPLKPDYKTLFVNPYNFVSTTSCVTRKPVVKADKTGYILCTLKVKDKLALPDHSAEDPRRQRSFDFYKVEGKPVIPGSELRGCIRSVFEAITPSCYSVINNNVLTSRVAKPERDMSILPGVLKFNGKQWGLYAAEKVSKKKGEPDVTRKWHKLRDGTTISYFYITDDEPEYILSKEEINNFTELLDIYVENNKRCAEIIRGMKASLKSGKNVAVFYKFDSRGRLEYFSPAQVSRTMHRNTVPGLLGEHAHGICSGKESSCPACSLFGTLGNGSALASRVRFSDAAAGDNVTVASDYVNMPELSKPKITSVEFYSTNGNAQYRDVRRWDYDSPTVELNGRKFYYHSKPKSESVLGERSIATKPVGAGSEFTFKLYFDKISETELSQLLWVLTLGDNSADSSLMHKLGYGRPVGYGSVKITVDSIVERSFDPQNGYVISSKSFDDYAVTEELFTEKKALSQLKQIADYNYVIERNVSYPIADDGLGKRNSKAAHQWFKNNRTAQHTFMHVLHGISPNTDDLCLPAMYASGTAPRSTPYNSPRTPSPSSDGLDIGKIYDVMVSGSKPTKNGDGSIFFAELNGKRVGVFVSNADAQRDGLQNGIWIRIKYLGLDKRENKYPTFRYQGKKQ